MFRETLLIVPRISSGDAARMEQNLGGRFRAIAGRFKWALTAAIKGSIIGISLGLLTRLLNPLEKIIDRTEKLLEQSTDLEDLADKLGTNVPALLSAQIAANNLGVKPEDFKKLLESFAEGVEKARDELKNPFQPRSESTQALKNFTNENILTGFGDFLRSLAIEGNSSRTFDELLSQRAKDRATSMSAAERAQLISSGEIRVISGEERRRRLEKTVFGRELFNTRSGEELVQNFAKEQRAVLERNGILPLSDAAKQLRSAAEVQRRIEGENQIRNFKRGGQLVTPNLVAALEENKQREIGQTFDQMVAGKIDALLEGKKSLDEIAGAIAQLQTQVLKLVVFLEKLVKIIPYVEGYLRKWSGQ